MKQDSKTRVNQCVTFYTDSDSREIARVPLGSSGDHAILTAEDYQRVIAAGFGTTWWLNRGAGRLGYVAAHRKGFPTQTIARLVAYAGAGEHVRYHDRDRLNLLPENLYLTDGRASRSATAALTPQDATEDVGQ